MKIYKVFLNGVDMSFCIPALLSWKEALREYKIYKGQGYKDVKIIDTTTTKEKK